MAKYPRLMKRGSVYYHRASIPQDIKDTYPKKEETFSLGTKDFHEAVRLLRVKAAEVDARFEGHRRRLRSPQCSDLPDETVTRLADLYYRHLLEEDDEERLERMRNIQAGYVPDDADFDEKTEWAGMLAHVGRQELARGRIDDHTAFEVEDLLDWEGVSINLEKGSTGWLKLVRAIQVATIRAHEAVKARQEGQLVETPREPVEAFSVDPVDTGVSPLLSEVLPQWYESMKRRSVTSKTVDECERTLGLFVELVGDRLLCTYSKADARAFKEAMLSLPCNKDKAKALAHLPLKDAIAKARELGLPTVAHARADKLFGIVSTFWTWVEGHYDEPEAPARSPFRGIKIERAERKNARKERDSFTIEELQRIFSAPLYTGCRSLHFYAQPGDTVPRDSGRYWVPLIALYSGARSGEIIQLNTDDIQEESGISFFNITEEGEGRQGRGVKTASSNRRVPIHPVLLDLGFLALVERRRHAGVRRLFPELTKGKDGYYSSNWSKFFNGKDHFLDKVGVYRRGLTFHSFRHTFEDACREAGLSKEVMGALQGHAEGGMAGRYGEGYSLAVLFEALRKVRYEGLSLIHLLPYNELV